MSTGCSCKKSLKPNFVRLYFILFYFDISSLSYLRSWPCLIPQSSPFDHPFFALHNFLFCYNNGGSPSSGQPWRSPSTSPDDQTNRRVHSFPLDLHSEVPTPQGLGILAPSRPIPDQERALRPSLAHQQRRRRRRGASPAAPGAASRCGDHRRRRQHRPGRVPEARDRRRRQRRRVHGGCRRCGRWVADRCFQKSFGFRSVCERGILEKQRRFSSWV